jgi:hypothetical protein
MHTVHKDAKFEDKEQEGMSVLALCKAIGEFTQKDLALGSGVTCEKLACGSFVIILLAENQDLNFYAAHVNGMGRS